MLGVTGPTGPISFLVRVEACYHYYYHHYYHHHYYYYHYYYYYWYSSDNAQRELSKEYQQDRANLVLKYFCSILPWTEEASVRKRFKVELDSSKK